MTLIELLAVLCVIFILTGTFAVYAKITLKIARETALKNELNNIRLSIEHFRVINGRIPEDLASLMNQNFTFRTPNGTIIQERFLKAFRVDKQGYLLDPFLNKYDYDSAGGRVASNTQGYINW